jgi:hypothetical protein
MKNVQVAKIPVPLSDVNEESTHAFIRIYMHLCRTFIARLCRVFMSVWTTESREIAELAKYSSSLPILSANSSPAKYGTLLECR